MMVGIRKFLLGLGIVGSVLGHASAWADEVPDPKKMEIIGELKGEWRYSQSGILNEPLLQFESGKNNIEIETQVRNPPILADGIFLMVSSRYFSCESKGVYLKFSNDKVFKLHPDGPGCAQSYLIVRSNVDDENAIGDAVQHAIPVMLFQGNRALLLKAQNTDNYDIKRFLEMNNPMTNPEYFKQFIPSEEEAKERGIPGPAEARKRGFPI